MIWAKFNRFINTFVLAIAVTTAAVGGVYYMGYPWNCNQAIQKRSEATLRLREAVQGNYPPGSPYRQYREQTKRDAEAMVSSKCESENITTSSKRAAKFFLKDRSDY